MKKTLAAAIAAIAAIALSLSALGAGYTVKTLDGQTLTDVQVGKLEADSVRLKYSDGIINVRLENLSAEDKKLLGIQARLDLTKKRADEALAFEKRREAAILASHKLTKEISVSDYPPELRNSVERYNLNVAIANKDLIAVAPDINKALELLDSSASKAEFETIQREFEQTRGQVVKEDKQDLRRKAGDEQYMLRRDLEAFDNYKAIITGANNESEIRSGMAKDETFVGMPGFALRIVKGQPHEATKIGRHEQWTYVNAKGLFDYYYLDDGKLVSEKLR